jgi:hypothetical protein
MAKQKGSDIGCGIGAACRGPGKRSQFDRSLLRAAAVAAARFPRFTPGYLPPQQARGRLAGDPFACFADFMLERKSHRYMSLRFTNRGGGYSRCPARRDGISMKTRQMHRCHVQSDVV